jgi:hypothetical protein
MHESNMASFICTNGLKASHWAVSDEKVRQAMSDNNVMPAYVFARRREIELETATLAAIGNEFGITRERVRQIINQPKRIARQPAEWTIVCRRKDGTVWKTRCVERCADSNITLLIVTMIAVTKDDANGNPVAPNISEETK